MEYNFPDFPNFPNFPIGKSLEKIGKGPWKKYQNAEMLFDKISDFFMFQMFRDEVTKMKFYEKHVENNVLEIKIIKL